MSDIILTTAHELSQTLRNVLIEFDKEKTSKLPGKVYTINQVAKKLGKAHSTIKKYVEQGIIKGTTNGLITESAINEYLGQ